jgi:prevent-host-death family protein
MKTVNIHEAKTHLSKLLERVARGESVIIGKAGKPIAVLSPFVSGGRIRKPGSLKGKIWMAQDFDADDGRIADWFEGRSDAE